MSYTIYPSKLIREREWTTVVPMEGDTTRLTEAAKSDPYFEGEAFEPNPEYFPFSSIDMSGGNLYAILGKIGYDTRRDENVFAARIPIQDMMDRSHAWLTDAMRGNINEFDPYVWERIFQFREMTRLGIARGATHIVWA